ncbi:MAG TPA: hypothetical protein DD414_11155, partial [Lachnospiraceae bacterium]|nr:hypothetical protein [Lachnospiraceae bacterium]
MKGGNILKELRTRFTFAGALHRLFYAYIMMAVPTGDAVLGAGGENSGKERKKMKRKIRTIMCCCGNGVGTSLVMQMTI